MVMVENICAVEKLDYGALGKSNMGQIIHKTSDENTAIIYFQAKVCPCSDCACTWLCLPHLQLPYLGRVQRPWPWNLFQVPAMKLSSAIMALTSFSSDFKWLIQSLKLALSIMALIILIINYCFYILFMYLVWNCLWQSWLLYLFF